MEEQIRLQIEMLRYAASQRDWNGCLAAVEKLCRSLKATDVVDVARSELSLRLAWFEENHPGVVWPRICLEALKNIETEQAEIRGLLVDAPDDESSLPGANNFMGAVDRLIRCARSMHDVALCASLATEAIAGGIMAEIVAEWGARFPDRWRAWISAPTDVENPPGLHALNGMMTDSETGRIELRSWLRVASELEQRFSTIRRG